MKLNTKYFKLILAFIFLSSGYNFTLNGQSNGSIGDFVWSDFNGDGVQDVGELGLSGVTVYLDLNSNGTLDGGEQSSVTDGNGAYAFTGLASSTYLVTIDNSSLPSGLNLTTGNNPFSISLASGEDVDIADFGFQQQDGSIGDLVWSDLNGDGVQDGGEPGLSGVTVYLDLNSNGLLDGGEQSTVTDGNGAYDITGLALGSYEVTIDNFSLPSGSNLTTANNPLTISLASGEDVNIADFGFQPTLNSTIGDFIWEDLNGDGVQDGGEPGLAGVTVFLDLNGNGTLDGGEPSQSTDPNGNFSFTGLGAGTYIVGVTNIPAEYISTNGSNFSTVTVAIDEINNTVDFGFALPAEVPTLSQWGLIILILFSFIFGIAAIRTLFYNRQSIK